MKLSQLFRREMKTEPAVNAERVLMELSSRYSPIKNLTPAILSTHLDNFSAGDLRDLMLLASKMIERDDKLRSLDSKRRKSVSRLSWEIVSFDETPEAARQKEVLEAFYGSLTSTSAIDEDDVGGIKHLIRMMLKSVSYGWSVQEIVWQPGPTTLTATFRDIPLWYFEHHTSRLRYLQSEGAWDGVEMTPGEWLITRGDGLITACAILYLFKHMPLRDWLIYCQRYVVPGLHGKTPAAKGSSEWNNLVSALKAFNLDWAVVTNTEAEIDTIDVSAKGELPYPTLIERCDRAMAILYRGADLSTMSSTQGQGQGASVQDDEGDILVGDDVEIVVETLARRVTPFVLKYALGAETALAGFRLVLPDGQDTNLQLSIDDKLIGWGCPVSKTDLLERYGRPQPDAGEDLATAPTFAQGAAGTPALVNARPIALLNAAAGDRLATIEAVADSVDTRLQSAARAALAQAMAEDLAPLRARLEAALVNQDGEAMLASLRQLQGELPDLLLQICANPASQRIIEDSITAALFNGVAEGAASRKGVIP